MRPSKDEWAMQMARITAQRSTCLRRSVGCVLLDIRGHVLATGYNGVAARLPHCNEPQDRSSGSLNSLINIQMGANNNYPNACPGAQAPSGTQLDACHAIHAEQNALLQCRDVYAIHSCYTTTAPCVTCTKLLLNTSCQRIIYLEEYVQPEAKALWLSVVNHTWLCHKGE